MSEKSDRLMRSLGSENEALSATLRSEIMTVFRQYMDVSDVKVDFSEDGANIRVEGSGWKRVGYHIGN